MITVEQLTKRYGAFTAVDDVSFDVKPGRVTGFLGPNGAGKSTAMRMICGLTPPTSGTTQVLGKPYHALPNPGRHLGVLLDASAQHAGRTGREVLTLGALMMGVDRSRADAMLELVGLTPKESGRRVRNYSLGMRQRLGIAHALLGDPQVLVLDEPANGLDPAGIRWMRTLLRDFATGGGTVLLSSHLLHEIEVVADELIVIGQGRIVAQGSKDELLFRGRLGGHQRGRHGPGRRPATGRPGGGPARRRRPEHHRDHRAGGTGGPGRRDRADHPGPGPERRAGADVLRPDVGPGP